MTVQTSEGRARQPLGAGQKVLVGSSAALLVGSALTLWRYVPQLPARIPTHWSGVSAPDGFGPPSELWTLWWTAASVSFVLGLLAFNLPASGRLNGMPPVPEQHQPRVRQLSRSLLLALQLVATSLLCGLLLADIVRASGGPDLRPFAFLLVAFVPVLLGVFSFKASLPPG